MTTSAQHESKNTIPILDTENWQTIFIKSKKDQLKIKHTADIADRDLIEHDKLLASIKFLDCLEHTTNAYNEAGLL